MTEENKDAGAERKETQKAIAGKAAARRAMITTSRIIVPLTMRSTGSLNH
jgi:hypothetical protein